MEREGNGLVVALLGLACIGLLVAFVYGGAAMNDYAEVTNKYDWAHGYGASAKTTYEHCEKWVQKHWTGSEANYKYHCEWLYKWDSYDAEGSYSDFKRWYKYAYDSKGNKKSGAQGFLTWLKKHPA